MDLETSGLTRRELVDLIATLEASTGVESVRERTQESDGGTFEIQASATILVFHLIVGFVGAQALPGVKEFTKAVGKKTGDAFGDVVANWVRRRFAGNSDLEVSVVLLGEDGKPVRKLKGKR